MRGFLFRFLFECYRRVYTFSGWLRLSPDSLKPPGFLLRSFRRRMMSALLDPLKKDRRNGPHSPAIIQWALVIWSRDDILIYYIMYDLSSW